MAKQFLGEKKKKRIETILGEPIQSALVRGGWTHFWAEVWTWGGRRFWVNWKTGEIENAEESFKKMIKMIEEHKPKTKSVFSQIQEIYKLSQLKLKLR